MSFCLVEYFNNFKGRIGEKMKIKLVLFVLYVFVGSLKGQQFILFDESNSPINPNYLSNLAIDSTNDIYVGSKYIYKYDGSWKLFDSLKIDSLSYSIGDIAISPNGTIWTSLSGGISQGKVLSFFNSKMNVLDYQFGLCDPTYIYVENDTTLYFSLINAWPHQQGEDLIGIYENDSIKTVLGNYYWWLGEVVPVSNDTLLFSSGLGIVRFYGNETKLIYSEDNLAKLKKIKDEIFLFGKSLLKYKNGGFIYYTNVDTLLNNISLTITSFTVDNKGVFWIGTDKGSLIKYGIDYEIYSLANSPIYDLSIDKNGNKWFLSDEGCYIFNEDKIVSTKKEPTEIFSYNLLQNFPNPFNPSTVIKYQVPANAKSEMPNVKLVVYDILGNEVATLVNEKQAAGNYEVKFDASNLSSGVYIYQLQSGSFISSKKMMFLK